MKKILVSLFLLVLGLCLVGCVDTPNGPGSEDPYVPQESWPDDPLQIVRNDDGKIVFSAIALTGDSCDIKYTDLNKNKTIDAKNKNEIFYYLREILYERESVYDYTNCYMDYSIKITYDMPNSGIVPPNTYEFKFSSENGPMTILKNGDLIGTVILSIDEVKVLLDYIK